MKTLAPLLFILIFFSASAEAGCNGITRSNAACGDITEVGKQYYTITYRYTSLSISRIAALIMAKRAVNKFKLNSLEAIQLCKLGLKNSRLDEQFSLSMRVVKIIRPQKDEYYHRSEKPFPYCIKKEHSYITTFKVVCGLPSNLPYPLDELTPDHLRF